MSAIAQFTARPVAAKATFGKSSVSTKFGLKASLKGTTVCMAKVTLKTPSGDSVIECADDVYILDAAEVRATCLPIHSLRLAAAAAQEILSTPGFPTGGASPRPAHVGGCVRRRRCVRGR